MISIDIDTHIYTEGINLKTFSGKGYAFVLGSRYISTKKMLKKELNLIHGSSEPIL